MSEIKSYLKGEITLREAYDSDIQWSKSFPSFKSFERWMTIFLAPQKKKQK